MMKNNLLNTSPVKILPYGQEAWHEVKMTPRDNGIPTLFPTVSAEYCLHRRKWKAKSDEKRNMAALHNALQSLKPISIDGIPEDRSNLCTYVRDLLIQARLVADSVPEPPSITSSSTSQTLTKDATPESSPPPVAIPKSSSTPDLEPSEILALRKEWGSPCNRIDNAKENPMHIPVYKLRGKDGKGAWFARRSIHVGPLSYEKFREKLGSELTETLRLRERTGEVKSIRGVRSERCLEEIHVPLHTDQTDHEEGLGTIEVHHLSIDFPGPSTSRDFVTLLIASDKLMDVSSQMERETEHAPSKSFVLISKPCDHPDAPIRKGFIRGQYESVEMIREIENPGENLTGNPGSAVEWIMVTRSDPGGSIPRWMVEKGTVPSIIADAKKFMDWASQDDSEGETETLISGSPLDSRSSQESQEQSEEEEAETSKIDQNRDEAYTTPLSPKMGLAAGFPQGVSSALGTLAPKVLYDHIDLPAKSELTGAIKEDGAVGNGDNDDAHNEGISQDDDECFSDSSMESFASVASYPKTQQENGLQVHFGADNMEGKERGDGDTLSSKKDSTASSSIASFPQDKIPPDVNGKEFSKLARRKERVLKDLKSNKERHDEIVNEISRHTVSGIDTGVVNRDAAASTGEKSKNKTPPNKRLLALSRQETKLSAQLQKIESQQNKITAKAELRRRKEREKDEKAKLKIELSTLKKEMSLMKVEMEGLRKERSQWLTLMGKLQEDNAKLAAQIPKNDD